MVVCATCTRLLPRSHGTHNANALNSHETTRCWKHELPIRIIMSGGMICANYAYVDLPVYFIQICKVLHTVFFLIIAWDVSTRRLARSSHVRQRFRSHGSHNLASRYPRFDHLLHIRAHYQQRLDLFHGPNNPRSRGGCIQHETGCRDVRKFLPLKAAF